MKEYFTEELLFICAFCIQDVGEDAKNKAHDSSHPPTGSQL